MSAAAQLPLAGTDGPFAWSALMSPDDVYRYELRRQWGAGWLTLFCGANPSTATAVKNDHTITKEMGFATRWGCGGIVKININPFRSTDPDGVPALADSAFLLAQRANADVMLRAMLGSRVQNVVVAWGDCLRRNPTTAIAIRCFSETLDRAGRAKDVQCFGLTKHGNPKHPLTLAYATPLEPWSPPTGGAL